MLEYLRPKRPGIPWTPFLSQRTRGNPKLGKSCCTHSHKHFPWFLVHSRTPHEIPSLGQLVLGQLRGWKQRKRISLPWSSVHSTSRQKAWHAGGKKKTVCWPSWPTEKQSMYLDQSLWAHLKQIAHCAQFKRSPSEAGPCGADSWITTAHTDVDGFQTSGWIHNI